MRLNSKQFVLFSAVKLVFGKKRQSSAELSVSCCKNCRAASVISRTVGEVRSHDLPQLPEELKGDLHVLVAMWVYAHCRL